jgi:formylglycine-generating enzyme
MNDEIVKKPVEPVDIDNGSLKGWTTEYAFALGVVWQLFRQQFPRSETTPKRIMKHACPLHSLFIVMALIAGVHSASGGASPVITSFSQNGVLVCSQLNPGSVATVEWAAALAGPWQTNWASLSAVTADSNGTISVSVPMFYRVLVLATNSTPSISVPAGMSLIPAGSFIIGNSSGDNDIVDAIPMNVYVSAFCMDVNLVSSNQWAAVYAYATTNGYSFDPGDGLGKAGNHPVQTVNWYDCVKWCNARSQQAGLTPVYYTDAGFVNVYTNGDTDSVYANWSANGFRLPTEAEWEEAARGGLAGQRFPWGNSVSESQANYYASPSGYLYDGGPYTGFNTNFDTGGYPYTSPVGSFAANGYGLNDMAGNVWEWCWDWYAGTPYPSGSPYLGGSDPCGPASSPGGDRVLRGGYWDEYASYERCAYRDHGYYPSAANRNIGFRCVKGH